MQVAQHYQQISSNFYEENHQEIFSTTMSNRIHQPLIFSIDDRLSEQHLTKLDLSSKNLKRIEHLPNDISFNIILFDYNELTKIEHLDIYPQLIQVKKKD